MTTPQESPDLWQTTSNRIWKGLSAEERNGAAIELVKDPSPVIRASVIAVVADARKMRPVAARKLPVDAQARILASIRDPGEMVASSLLVALHLGPRRPMLVKFLDAIGLPHEEGVLKDEGTAPVSADDLAKGVAAIADSGPSAVRVYLNTLWLQDPERWTHAREAVPAQ